MALSDNGKTSLPTAEAADHLLSGGSFVSRGAPFTTLTYSFRATAPSTMPDDTSGFSTFNAQQIHATEDALQAWSDVANIRFERIGSGDTGPEAYSDAATLRFANYADGVTGAAAFTFLPNTIGNRSTT